MRCGEAGASERSMIFVSYSSGGHPPGRAGTAAVPSRSSRRRPSARTTGWLACVHRPSRRTAPAQSPRAAHYGARRFGVAVDRHRGDAELPLAADRRIAKALSIGAVLTARRLPHAQRGKRMRDGGLRIAAGRGLAQHDDARLPRPQLAVPVASVAQRHERAPAHPTPGRTADERGIDAVGHVPPQDLERRLGAQRQRARSLPGRPRP